MPRMLRVLSFLIATALFLAGSPEGPGPARRSEDPGGLLVAGARRSIAEAPAYDQSYVKLKYPGGDPGWRRGACTDVVIRAFRAVGVDLQKHVHEDIAASPGLYGVRSPDRSIDHRRARNLRIFFERHARTIPVDGETGRTDTWLPGDIVIWDLYGGNSPNHIGIISDRRDASGRPLVIHHFAERDGFSGRPSEDDCLARWRVLGHYRWERDRGDR